MDKRSDDIRQDIEQTRASLDSKLDLLQNKASEAVDQTKQLFDVNHQVNERPWLALGAALLAGYVVGNLGNGEDDAPISNGANRSQMGVAYDYNQHADSGPSTMDTIKEKGRDFLSQFDDEIDMLKAAAMGALTTFVRDAAREAVPGIGNQIDRLLKERGMSTGTTASSAVRSTAPNASMSYESGAGRTNSDAVPQMNRYGAPPATPTRDDETYYSTYKPDEDTRTVGQGEPKRY